ncbi:hypothetical protein FHX10_003132 [Rhizobium sp. BK591]|nr:hypothetical protein [Rhizobium sp. BK591]
MHADGPRLGKSLNATDEGEGASRCAFHGSELDRSRIQRADGAAELDRDDHVSTGRVKGNIGRLELLVLVDKRLRIVGDFERALYRKAALARRAVETFIGNCRMRLLRQGGESQQHRYERHGFPYSSPAFEHVYFSRRHSQHILLTYVLPGVIIKSHQRSMRSNPCPLRV